MRPWELVGEALAPDGTTLTLIRHPTELVILANGESLMSSRMHGSEEALASAGCRRARTLTSPTVLVGGLGMGFTLRAALDTLPPGAIVIVAELVSAVADWNRGPLGPLAGHPLRDPRVRLEVGDVADLLRRSRNRFDAVLLDVDNGPVALASTTNAGLYDNRGVVAAHDALTADGTLAVWSSRDHRKFEQRLRWAGFAVQTLHVRARLRSGGPRHTIILGQRAASTPQRANSMYQSDRPVTKKRAR